MALFEKKINARNSVAVINEVNKMLDAGFPKKETYVVVGKKYNLSYKSVQRIMSGHVLDTTNQDIGHVLDKPITSADIVDGIIKKFGKKGDDYVDAFNRAPKGYSNKERL